MKKITLGGMQASDIVLGCMRISDMAVSRVQELLETAVEEGINYFDHADLYGHGASEEVFAKAMGQKPSLRERIYLQSKCGIRDDGGLFRYDFSKSHILKSVDGILRCFCTGPIRWWSRKRWPRPLSFSTAAERSEASASATSPLC